jgi:serine/threonine-protein kinase
LLERLGRGGAAESWRARRVTPLFEDEVCVKLPHALLEPDERRAVLEEARIMARVRHANVVTLLDVVEDVRARPVLVLELVRGADLSAIQRMLRLRSARLPGAVTASLLRSLCLALAAAQRALPAGIVHRDVTPHNVLVSLEGETKLADFGIARALDRGRWTRSGLVKGKCAYIAPELVRGDGCDVKSDLFSLGVIGFELCAGTRPFAAPNVLAELAAIERGARRSLAEAAPTTPRGLVSLVEALLAHDPKNRPSPDQAARALSQLADDQCALETLRNAARLARAPGLARAGDAEVPLGSLVAGGSPRRSESRVAPGTPPR